jgi:hypothetical protein
LSFFLNENTKIRAFSVKITENKVSKKSRGEGGGVENIRRNVMLKRQKARFIYLRG